jgi:hypothetical protein
MIVVDVPRLLLIAALVGLMAPMPSRAGSSTAESVWDRRNARARAMEQVPRGALITGQRCMEIGMRGNEERYRCTVWYTVPASNTPPPGALSPALIPLRHDACSGLVTAGADSWPAFLIARPAGRELLTSAASPLTRTINREASPISPSRGPAAMAPEQPPPPRWLHPTRGAPQASNCRNAPAAAA